MLNPIIESCAAQLLSLKSLDLDESIDSDDPEGLLEPLLPFSLMVEDLQGAKNVHGSRDGTKRQVHSQKSAGFLGSIW